MHKESLHQWQRGRTFGLEPVRRGERQTWIVVAITLLTMIVEIVAELAFGAMALNVLAGVIGAQDIGLA